jgi:hypothetical protein
MVKLTALGLLALCACSTAPAKPDRAKEMVLYSSSSPGAPPPEGTIVCQVERPTGSNITTRVCRYQNQNDWNAQQAQQMMRELQQRPCAEKCNP